jgi:NADPH-dependent curcumin reductase CurA
VGSVVGQIAKLNGCTVIGIAGGIDKCDYVTNTLGFDYCIDYKQDTSIRKLLGEALKSVGAKGVDIYFDNVGGDMLNANLAYLSFGARVVICGAISQYNATEITPGPSNYMNLLVKRGTMTGFLVFDYASQFSVAQRRMGTWISQGKITAPETIVEGGLEQFPATLNRLFAGENLGKLVLKIS